MRKKKNARYQLETLVDVSSFLRELESHCYTSAIITLSDGQEQPFVIDMEKTQTGFTYGYAVQHKALFIRRLGQCQLGGLIMRSFLKDERDPETGYPIKELRGYHVGVETGELTWVKISEEEMFLAQNTDNETGDMLLPERGVRYE
ncbi:MAG TPA: hypothetical protein VKU00_07295 [Chthonomonadaceae bacterium]|nr:hypothetical protein [Chthonomonadaceae bacterium]